MWVIALPVQYTFMAGNTPHQLYMSLGYNLLGEDAIEDSVSPYAPNRFTGDFAQNGDHLSFSFGYSVGQSRNPRDWKLALEYRFLGAASITPNLSDSDFGKNRLNQSGFILNGSFMLSESVRLGATYMSSSSIRDIWESDAADLLETELLQVDLSAKF